MLHIALKRWTKMANGDLIMKVRENKKTGTKLVTIPQKHLIKAGDYVRIEKVKQ